MLSIYMQLLSKSQKIRIIILLTITVIIVFLLFYVVPYIDESLKNTHFPGIGSWCAIVFLIPVVLSFIYCTKGIIAFPHSKVRMYTNIGISMILLFGPIITHILPGLWYKFYKDIPDPPLVIIMVIVYFAIVSAIGFFSLYNVFKYKEKNHLLDSLTITGIGVAVLCFGIWAILQWP